MEQNRKSKQSGINMTDMMTSVLHHHSASGATHLLNLLQVTVDVVPGVRRIPVLSVLLQFSPYEVFRLLPDLLHSLVRPWRASHQHREGVVELQVAKGKRTLSSLSFSPSSLLCLCECPYLGPNRGFDLHGLVKQVDQIHEPLVVVFKAMTENQRADDVGDDVVDDEVRGQGFTCRDGTRRLDGHGAHS